ncbi:MAG: hypothetical protein ACRDRP_16045 [Pseudonocardiaceae bacterium]
MPIQIKDDQQVADAHNAADTTTQRAPDSDAAEPTIQRVPDLMVQLVRQGQDTSLRSLQVWADLARQLGPTALGSPASTTPASTMRVSPVFDLFEKLHAAQREIVDELVDAQRQLAQRYLGRGRA